MKTIIYALVFSVAFASVQVNAQSSDGLEMIDTEPGNTLNIGGGAGYLLHVGQPMIFGGLGYEFGLGKNVTLAPSIGIAKYGTTFMWPEESGPSRLYRYTEIAVPVALTASYYFDNLMGLSDNWDMYAGAAAGYVFSKVNWETSFNGDKSKVPHVKPLFMAAHVGTRYHINNDIGVFADLSSAVSAALGISFRF